MKHHVRPGTQDPDERRAASLPVHRLAGAAAACVVVVTVVAIAGSSRNRDVAIGAVAFLAALVIGVSFSRVRDGAKAVEIERLATRDPLTGLANRRILDEVLPREIARARRTEAPLSLIALDVDHFKDVNDIHGHQAGDDVLRSLAAALENNTKGYDVAVRLGGDEFAVLLPGCSAADAASVAERLLLRTVVEVRGHPVTFSAGYATFTDEMVDGDELMASADAGLYAAKRAGRSQTATVQRRVMHMVEARRSA